MKWQSWVLVMILLCAGVGGFSYALLAGLAQSKSDLTPIEAPGETEFAVEQPGEHVIFHEYARTVDSQGLRKPGGVESLQCALQEVSTGATIELLPETAAHPYAIRRTLREAVMTFTAPSAGQYRFVAEYPPDFEGVPIRFVVGRHYQSQVVPALARGIAVLAITGMLIALAVFASHRSASGTTSAAGVMNKN